MGCSARPTRKSFFGFVYNAEDPHEWEINSIEKRAFGTWVVVEKCRFCYNARTKTFVSDSAISRTLGFLPETGIYGRIYRREIDEQARGIRDGNKS